VSGKVYLVGAGPGDPGLFTLKGKRCLERADVVIYDYLANPRLLDYAPPRARRILVGKHGGGKRVEQDVITAMVIEHARAGRNVVRLKGGDPFIFGRGGEEAAALYDAGFEFEIVPGVSAAIAVPAYAGIPLTHRQFASNVVFTTGYEYTSKEEPAVRWHELARSGSTLVILMATRQLRSSMQKLMAAGLAAHTPAAVVRWGTRAAQQTLVGEVGTIADTAESQHLQPPAIAVVGKVVSLREKLNWFERKPLFGRRIVITRPRAQAAEFAEQLEAWGAEVIPFPTIETIATADFTLLDAAIHRASEFDWVVFTSANGVRVFFERLQAIGGDVREWHRARLAAIGPQTAKAIQQYCLRVEMIPEEFRAEAIVTELARAGVSGKRLLLPRAAAARNVLPVQLRAHGAIVEEVATYTTSMPPVSEELRSLVLAGGADLITFTSSSTVHNFAAIFAGAMEAVLAHCAIGCIGPVTADTARSYGMRVAIQPSAYTIPAFVEAIVSYYTRSETLSVDSR